MTPSNDQGRSADATFRLSMAVVLGVAYGPRYNPGTGRLPAEIGEGVPAWASIRTLLTQCVAEWEFTGTAEQAKLDARETIAAKLASTYTLQTAAARYKILIDPVTGEIYGHVYDGWIYEGGNPVEVKFDAESGAFASILFATRIVE